MEYVDGISTLGVDAYNTQGRSTSVVGRSLYLDSIRHECGHYDAKKVIGRKNNWEPMSLTNFSLTYLRYAEFYQFDWSELVT